MANVILVIDSSVIIKWLSKDNENHLDFVDKILEDAQNDRVVLIAPELAKYEIGNVLLYSKKLTSKQGKIALTQFYNLPIKFVSESEELAKQTYDLAFSLEVTYYDASFISLAKQYNATLVTDNIKDQGKASEVKVISLKDYK